MTPTTMTTLATVGASLLLLAAAFEAQRAVDLAAPEDAAPSWADQIDAAAASLTNTSDAASMSPSQGLIDHLKASEALKLTRYRLGDGGWTIGYGRYYPDGATPPPERIDAATADAWFASDLEARGAKWVRAYVTEPLQQCEFDALCSMAFNLKPSSFKQIADAVNAGQGPDDAAMQFIRAGTNLERGLRNRRAGELAMFHQGVYA